MTGALVRYKQISIEVDVENFKKIRINGVQMDLKKNETVKFGGVTVRYGKQNVEWRGAKDVTNGLKMSTPEGFGVLIIGGYCGVLETSVPTNYYGRMGGICGNADGAKNAADYFSPGGEIMNVNRGAKRWEMTGYNGPNSPLSKWQLAWKPTGSRCFFAAGCEAGPTVPFAAPVAPKAVVSAPKVAVPVAPAPVAPKPFPIAMTCDNEFDLFVAGKKVGRGDTWTTTYEFSPIVNAGDVIAVDGVDRGGPAAFIGVFNGKVTKPDDWKCTTSKFTNWNENSFDDSAWPRAVSFSRNQDNNIWRSVGGGSRPKIPADAEWLWTSNNENHDRVYCRYTPIKVAVVEPKVVAPEPKVAPVVTAPKVAPVAKVVAPESKVAEPKVAEPKVAEPKVAEPKVAEPKVVLPEPSEPESKMIEPTFSVYGNYCGPNYCGGQKFKGAEGPSCQWGVSPKDSLDACCKAHDKCCGLNRSASCNKEILSCLNSVKCQDTKCNLAQAAMKLTFTALQNKVCGDVLASKPKTDVGSQFASVVAPESKSVKSTSSQGFATSKDDVIGNVNNMNTRIVAIIHETQTLQTREIEQNKKNVNISQTEMDNLIMKQDDEQNNLLKLQASILQTNQSIAAHYAQMNADSLYLQKLDLIKPQFLQTLDNTNANFAALSSHVSKLVNDEHKKFMEDILARARNATVYDTRDLAQAFLAHYEKYKHVLRADSATYASDISKLKELKERYASGQTMYFGLKAEVAKLRDLLVSLKKSVSASEADAALFAQLEQIISEILSSKKTKFVTDGTNKECAVSVLRSHVANGLV
jgi:hypothetical protein